MVSKLDNTGSPVPLRRADMARATAVARPPESSSAPTASTDRSSAAASSSLLARATDIARAAPEIDEAKVARIKEALAKGEFQMNPDAIARAFMDMESGR
ncbi:flagellar biosynthesis anti-sigma factor FlgM [Perlucidibaca piscinae]|uniref:flagellar biosynthesis anti-sigma factor FlgM n=1 Tax=Perlucidibaca piscinae TaxID=392589 RepID=UPI0003B6ADF0|nr:flagellar biosynthesis anti-sigma factor FlgM [Perlucidibaca piscinae]